MNHKTLGPKAINMLIGNGIRLHRKKRNLTIYTLAELINLSPSYLGLVERGQRGLSIYTLFQTLDIFSVTLEELIGEIETTDLTENIVAEDTNIFKTSYDTLLSLLYKMSAEEIVCVIDIVKSLKQYTKIVSQKEEI